MTIYQMKTNKKYLICNLKANKNKEEYIEYEKGLLEIPFDNDIELIICPSTPFLYLFQSETYKLGSQDISKYENGAHTGENTAEQLQSLNVQYALIGHSERRKLFKEEEQTIIDKIKKAYHSHIRPIYFIGESFEQRQYNLTSITLEKQLSHIIDRVPDYKREKMIIVYEPIWAIGSGKTPTIEEISRSIRIIKEILLTKYNIDLPILYGGSINEGNIDELITINNLDGYVLGESSKDINNVIAIYEKIMKKSNRQNNT